MAAFVLLNGNRILKPTAAFYHSIKEKKRTRRYLWNERNRDSQLDPIKLNCLISVRVFMFISYPKLNWCLMHFHWSRKKVKFISSFANFTTIPHSTLPSMHAFQDRYQFSMACKIWPYALYVFCVSYEYFRLAKFYETATNQQPTTK